jgi:hypothetical protein
MSEFCEEGMFSMLLACSWLLEDSEAEPEEYGDPLEYESLMSDPPYLGAE